MPKYRKKPVVVEAMQLTGPPAETYKVVEWLEDCGYPFLKGNALEPSTLVGLDDKPADKGIYINPATGGLVIRTLEGDMEGTYGDYIVKGVQGEFYPCKPTIFEATYERVGD